MKINVTNGTTAAAAAAALLMTGAINVTTAHAATGDVGKCMGANACKGKSVCKTAKNECKGHNACKGTGFLKMTKEECAKIEGATFEPMKEARGSTEGAKAKDKRGSD